MRLNYVLTLRQSTYGDLCRRAGVDCDKHGYFDVSGAVSRAFGEIRIRSDVTCHVGGSLRYLSDVLLEQIRKEQDSD